MIGKLSGLIESRGDDWVIVDVQGVGYQVHCSSRTIGALPSNGETASLAIETYVREDMIRLYGFARDGERDWFRLLMTVQGVGAKVALAILSTLSAEDLASAIALQDKAQVSRAPGVGPKVAQRIVSELKDKVPAVPEGDSALRLSQSIADDETPSAAIADAVSALVNLGYSPRQAAGAVASALKAAGADAETAELIRRGLRELAV